ncbi:MAG: tetratricopeptide repeat protein [Xanthobacteraceae bacterium]
MNRKERRRAAHNQRSAGVAIPTGPAGAFSSGPSGLLSLAERHHNAGQFSEAAQICRTILASDPHNPDGHLILGSAALNLGDIAAARAHLDHSIARRPRDVRAWIVSSSLFTRVGDPLSALEACTKAIEIAPGLAMAHVELGNILASQRKFELASEAYRRALALQPNYVDAEVNLGSALYCRGLFEQAADALRHALALHSGHVQALRNLAATLRQLGNYEEALATYRRATVLAPNFADAHRDEALLLLLLGRFDEGWEKYEWRWKAATVGAQPLNGVRWNGESLGDQTILLQSEQGIGDTLQFLRYVPMVAQRGGSVILQLPQSLARLYGAGINAAAQVTTLDEPLPHFDCHVTLMSLPRIFATTPDDVPDGVPYLHAPRDSADSWRRWFGAHDALRVGVVWSGNPDHENDLNRSIPLARMMPLFADREIQFYSLQVGKAAADLGAVTGGVVHDISMRLTDFGETAAAVEALDLVITVDTAVAHLAGAIGKPVWVLLPHVPDWRWQLGREDSPWYPTMRLYRQARRGDWEGVLDRVRRELTILAGRA